jgi:hypothetical protein
MLAKALELTVEELENDELFSKMYKDVINPYRNEGIDAILRKVPALVLATADVDFPRGRENSILWGNLFVQEEEI